MRNKKKIDCASCGCKTTAHRSHADSTVLDKWGFPEERYPTWQCGNCNRHTPRLVRRTKRQMALAKLLARRNPGQPAFVQQTKRTWTNGTPILTVKLKRHTGFYTTPDGAYRVWRGPGGAWSWEHTQDYSDNADLIFHTKLEAVDHLARRLLRGVA